MVKVDLSLEVITVMDNNQPYTYWKVKGCYVHLSNGKIRTLASGDEYESKEAVQKEMEKRVLKLLKENGRTETADADDIKWKTTTVDEPPGLRQ